MSHPLRLAVPECSLTDEQIGPQLARYRRLAEHVIQLERRAGEVRVYFDDEVPDRLLHQALSAESECCAFVRLDYSHDSRSLKITVETVAQAPRLDSFAALFTPPQSDSRNTHGAK